MFHSSSMFSVVPDPKGEWIWYQATGTVAMWQKYTCLHCMAVRKTWYVDSWAPNWIKTCPQSAESSCRLKHPKSCHFYLRSFQNHFLFSSGDCEKLNFNNVTKVSSYGILHMQRLLQYVLIYIYKKYIAPHKDFQPFWWSRLQTHNPPDPEARYASEPFVNAGEKQLDQMETGLWMQGILQKSMTNQWRTHVIYRDERTPKLITYINYIYLHIKHCMQNLSESLPRNLAPWRVSGDLAEYLYCLFFYQFAIQRTEMIRPSV